MNPMICYFYEYKNNQRIRTVGFAKIKQRYKTILVEMHLKGLSLQPGDSLLVSAFKKSGADTITSNLLTLTSESQHFHSRFAFQENELPEGRTLLEMDGLLLQGPRSEVYVASWMNVSVDTDRIHPYETAPDEHIKDTDEPMSDVSAASDSHDIEAVAAAETPAAVSSPEKDLSYDSESKTDSDEDNHSMYSPTQYGTPQPQQKRFPSDQPITPSPQDQLSPTQPVPSETENAATPMQDTFPHTDTEPEAQSGQEMESKQAPSYHKISRQDISQLPRKCWALANNSFLIHGCHNYHHLILIEKDGHLWLGVPGIIDAREERAARLLGFPDFTQESLDVIKLSPEERSPDQNFGYWCHQIC
ncbi:MAG: hypothetical protein PHN80_02945 [Hespellia sp.]|nr:hypothetical protein [Hespellia sp.]